MVVKKKIKKNSLDDIHYKGPRQAQINMPMGMVISCVNIWQGP